MLVISPYLLILVALPFMQQRLLPKPQGDQIRLPSATLRLKSVQNRQGPVRQADHRLNPLVLIGVVEVDLDPHLVAESLFLRCRGPLVDPGQSMRQRQPAAQVRLEVPVQLLLRSPLSIDRPWPELQLHPFPGPILGKGEIHRRQNRRGPGGGTVVLHGPEPEVDILGAEFPMGALDELFPLPSFQWITDVCQSHGMPPEIMG